MSDKYAVPNKLPGKTVSILAHRKRRMRQEESIVEQKKQLRIKALKEKQSHHKFRRAEHFVMKYLKAERTANRMKHVMRTTKLARIEAPDQKLLLVMRHKGKKIRDNTTYKMLSSLRLSQRHHAVFLKNSQENQILLRLVEPYVVYGFPTLSTIRDLLFKKGFARIDNKKTSIQSNTMIEEQLGDKGIICLEDIIHELYTVGPNFDAVNQFLCPFMLSSPRDGWQNKVSIPFSRGGEFGNRKEGINALIERCI